MELPNYISTSAFNLRCAIESGGLQEWHQQDLQQIVYALGGAASVPSLPPETLGLYLNLLLIEHLAR